MKDTAEEIGLDILAKADAVVRLLEEHGELPAAAIAQRLGEPMSSTYRLLTNLTAIAWVEVGTRRGLFRLGVYFLIVGAALEDRMSVREAAEPSLRRLLAATGATSFLCLRRGARAVCVERFEGRNVRSLALVLGDSLPLYVGAAPMALFAYLPHPERDAVMHELDVRREQGEPIPRRDDLLRRIADTRGRGYALSDGDVTPGIASLGAPVLDHRGVVAGAISISGLRAQILHTLAVTADLIQAEAVATSRALGYRESRR